MNTRDVVLLTIDALGGTVTGRTMLQKVIYFLGILTGTTKQLGYRPHYYGPYSSKVDEAVSGLMAIGLIDVHIQRSDCGFEKITYKFELTEDGKTIVRRNQTQFGSTMVVYETIARIKGEAEGLNYVQLAAAAQLHYLTKRLKPLQALEWADDDDVAIAVQFLQRLNLMDQEENVDSTKIH